MATLLYYASTVAVFAVVAVLMFGLATLMRGSDPNLSQKLMRWRVGLQFLAILLIVAFVIVNH